VLQTLLALVVVTASPGDTLWVRRFDGPGRMDDRPTGILADSKGNVIVTGYTFSRETDFNFLVVKYDSRGSLLWTQSYGSPLNSEDRIWAACLDAQDNIYVTGGSIADYAHNWDYLTIKYYPSGETAWMRRYDSPFHNEDKPHAIAVDDSGNVWVAGGSRNRDQFWDYLVVKYRPGGDTVWTRRFDGLAHSADEALAVAVDRQGNVAVTGKSSNEYRVPEIVTVKLDPAGRQLWAASLHGTGNGPSSPCGVACDAGGNVIVAGSVSDAATGNDYAQAKYTADGRQVWFRTYDGPWHRSDMAFALLLDSDGSTLVTGQSMGVQTSYDYATVKYDSAGETLWVRRVNGPVSAEDRAQAIAEDEGDRIYVTGGSVQVRPYEDYLTVAYDSDGDSLWSRSYRGEGSELAHMGASQAIGITARTPGRVVVTGYSYNKNGNSDVVTITYRTRD
jgi:uncharacterized delta-60 repeat protein